MQKWEYKWILLERNYVKVMIKDPNSRKGVTERLMNPEEYLNQLGSQGWEAVSLGTRDNLIDGIILLKRPIEE